MGKPKGYIDSGFKIKSQVCVFEAKAYGHMNRGIVHGSW